MTEIFTYTKDLNDLQVLVMLPENVCYKDNVDFLLNKIIRPSGMPASAFAFQPIPEPPKGKIKKAQIMELLRDTHEFCQTYGIGAILCGSSPVFKYLSGNAKFSENIGRAVYSPEIIDKKEVIIGNLDYQVVPLLNPVILNKYPHKVTEVQKGLEVAKSIINGTYTEPGDSLELDVNEIVQDPERALEVAKRLFKADRLFVDIETTGLRWQRDRLLTISFAVNSKEAYCFPLHEQYYGDKAACGKIRNIVTQFFQKFKGAFVGHNWVGFDQAFIVHELLRKGDFKIPHEEIITPFKLEDTMIMAYLLTNSTERPSIGLKPLVFKWLGDYDSDIDQKRLEVAPLEKVATYNNYDVVGTALIYEELWERIVEEGFEDVYNTFIEIGKQLLKVKMNGLRVDVEAAKLLSTKLSRLIQDDYDNMLDSPYVKEAEEILAEIRWEKDNKKNPFDDYKEPFNPSSPKQKQVLFFDVMELPVISRSKTTKEPSADSDSLKTWLEDDTVSEEKKTTISDIMEYQLAKKIESTYLATILENAVEVAEGDFRIFANFNQTATITGRLSSSGDINFQTIPSSSKYAKEVKKLFIPPEGFVLATADYSALEDRLMANESRDPNKIAVFDKGIDGHCLNAYAYFKDELESRGLSYDITDPVSINKLKDDAPDLRQAGKPYTFGFNYGAGPQKYGEQIYNAYWDLYKATKQYNDSVIKKARKEGFLISKFSGLRIWLPSIAAPDDFVRQKEERVAVNFSIQSGNFLMLRTINNFQKWIEANNLCDDIKIVNTVHDSVYLYVKEDPELIAQVNTKLIEIMCEPYESDLPVPLEAELDIGYNMVNLVTLPNKISSEEIAEKLKSLKEG